jgi:hypothetical protein
MRQTIEAPAIDLGSLIAAQMVGALSCERG